MKALLIRVSEVRSVIVDYACTVYSHVALESEESFDRSDKRVQRSKRNPVTARQFGDIVQYREDESLLTDFRASKYHPDYCFTLLQMCIYGG